LKGVDESWCGSPCHGNAWFLREEWFVDTHGLQRVGLLLDDGGWCSPSSWTWRSSDVPLTSSVILLPSTGGQVGHQRKMTTNLSKNSMKSMEYAEWAGVLVVVSIEHWQRSSRPRAKARGHDPTMLWFGGA